MEESHINTNPLAAGSLSDTMSTATKLIVNEYIGKAKNKHVLC